MPFNGPINGDYSVCDFSKAPWTSEIMTLTHEECVYVIDKCQEIVTNYDPKDNSNQAISDTYIHSKYNMSDWQYAISWNTYAILKVYDPEVNTLGIDAAGIVYPEVIEPPIEEAAPIETPAE
jgi:hypothetical protein